MGFSPARVRTRDARFVQTRFHHSGVVAGGFFHARQLSLSTTPSRRPSTDRRSPARPRTSPPPRRRRSRRRPLLGVDRYSALVGRRPSTDTAAFSSLDRSGRLGNGVCSDAGPARDRRFRVYRVRGGQRDVDGVVEGEGDVVVSARRGRRGVVPAPVMVVAASARRGGDRRGDADGRGRSPTRRRGSSRRCRPRAARPRAADRRGSSSDFPVCFATILSSVVVAASSEIIDGARQPSRRVSDDTGAAAAVSDESRTLAVTWGRRVRRRGRDGRRSHRRQPVPLPSV